jgi:hypothetical protein
MGREAGMPTTARSERVPVAFRPICLSFLLTCLVASPSHGGEIYIFYTNLKGELSLTATQDGNPIGDALCSPTECSLIIERLPAQDFPQEFLVAGVELYDPVLLKPRVFTDLVHYSVEHYLTSDPSQPCGQDPEQCLADIWVEFFAYPFAFLVTTDTSPVFAQPLANGLEQELTAYFENPSLNRNRVVGLPPAAIHVFVTADGKAAIPEPVSPWLATVGVTAALWRRRRSKAE